MGPGTRAGVCEEQRAEDGLHAWTRFSLSEGVWSLTGSQLARSPFCYFS